MDLVLSLIYWLVFSILYMFTDQIFLPFVLGLRMHYVSLSHVRYSFHNFLNVTHRNLCCVHVVTSSISIVTSRLTKFTKPNSKFKTRSPISSALRWVWVIITGLINLHRISWCMQLHVNLIPGDRFPVSGFHRAHLKSSKSDEGRASYITSLTQMWHVVIC